MGQDNARRTSPAMHIHSPAHPAFSAALGVPIHAAERSSAMTLEGTFADMPLIDLLHVFQSSRKTGRLLIVHRPYKAMLWFFDGALVNAAIVAQPSNERATCGEEAVFALLHWDDGVFTFIAPQPGEHYQVHIKHSVDWLIIEGLRRRELKASLPSYPRITGATRLALVTRLSGEEAQVTLTLDDWRVLSHLVAEASVDEVVRAVGYTLEQTLGIINRLIALNLVEIRAEIVLPQSRPVAYLPPDSGQHQLAPQQRMRHLVQSIKDRLRRVSA
jgi:hypothetical protein